MTLITPKIALRSLVHVVWRAAPSAEPWSAAGYSLQFKPSRENLDLLNPLDVQQWFTENQPTVVVLAAAKVGGVYANNTYPADFLLENLKIQTNVIETAAFRRKASSVPW